MEKLDFPGYQYEFRPIDMTYSFDGLVDLDLGFNFLDSDVREDNKKWHYPCVAKLECEVKVEEPVDYLALTMVLGQSLYHNVPQRWKYFQIFYLQIISVPDNGSFPSHRTL